MLDITAISSGLVLGEDQIWYSVDKQNISYPAEGSECCFAIEENSFWFRHRNDCIVSVVKSFPPIDNGAIFDMGGGNGFVSKGLIKAGFDVVLLEPGPVGAMNGKQRGIKNVICSTIETAKFKPHSLPAVGLFDVIEHIENDSSFLQTIRTSMKTGGHLYITVPSFSFLWSEEDDKAGHFRRYTIESISKVLNSSGFEVLFSSYFFRFLPIPIYLLRTLPYKLGFRSKEDTESNLSRDHIVRNAFSTKLLNRILKSEVTNLNKKKAMQFGGSCLIVARCCK